MTERRKVALIGCTGALLRESPGHSVEIVLSFTNREAAEEALDFLAGDEPRRTVEQAQREAEDSGIDAGEDGDSDEKRKQQEREEDEKRKQQEREEKARIQEERRQATAQREQMVAASLHRQNNESSESQEKKD